jgi:hypothetical protein
VRDHEDGEVPVELNHTFDVKVPARGKTKLVSPVTNRVRLRYC